jgi:hypothetical protein
MYVHIHTTVVIDILIILFLFTDTTGLQSSIAVVEVDGSITVTCIFATGASSIGCQVTLFTMNDLQVFSTNISRRKGATQVCKSLHVVGDVSNII